MLKETTTLLNSMSDDDDIADFVVENARDL
jgi:hypothetical protein